MRRCGWFGIEIGWNAFCQVLDLMDYPIFDHFKAFLGKILLGTGFKG